MKEFQPRHDQTRFNPERGKGTRGVRQPEPERAQTPVESAEGNTLAPLPPKHLSRREKQLVYVKRYYQKNKAERLAYKENYREGHKQEIRVYQRKYMRDYREGKRRRLQAEPPQSMQIFPSP
jgi:hypothetical protein